MTGTLLGRDHDGVEYWQVGQEVTMVVNGATRWFCSIYAWPVFCRMGTVTPA